MARWILLLLAICGAYAQSHTALTSKTSTTSEKITLQHDPAAPTRIQACSITINPTVSGTVYTEVGGTAATATSVTVVPTSPGGRAGRAKVYQSSDVGSGTATTQPMSMEAGKPFILNLKNVRLSGSGTTKNFTVVIALGSSGDVKTTIQWAEDDTCYNASF